MKLDISVAPEIALLAANPAGETAPATLGQPAAGRAAATIGQLAACLQMLVADPRAWWDLVRFDPHHPVRILLPAPRAGCLAWLLVLPPGHRDDAPASHAAGQEPGWEVACLLAGAMADQVRTSTGWQDRALSQGRTRVRGGAGPYRLANLGSGYAVSLHARTVRPAAASPGDRAHGRGQR